MKIFNLLRISKSLLFLLVFGLGVFAQKVPVESAANKTNSPELDRRNAEIAAQNLKVTEGNEVVARAIKAGNEALMMKLYDQAVKYYDEGLTFRPHESALLINKSAALRRRGVDSYNSSFQLKDETAKKSALGSAHKDWLAAVESSQRAVEILKASAVKTDLSEQERIYEQEKIKANQYAALSARAEALILVAERFDKKRLSEAVEASRELLAVESDSNSRNRIQRQIAKLFFSAEDFLSAKTEYRKVLANNPDDSEASFNFAFAAAATEDKTAYQEATIALQRFLDKAPQNHPQRADAQEVMQFLKSQ